MFQYWQEDHRRSLWIWSKKSDKCSAYVDRRGMWHACAWILMSQITQHSFQFLQSSPSLHTLTNHSLHIASIPGCFINHWGGSFPLYWSWVRVAREVAEWEGHLEFTKPCDNWSWCKFSEAVVSGAEPSGTKVCGLSSTVIAGVISRFIAAGVWFPQGICEVSKATCKLWQLAESQKRVHSLDSSQLKGAGHKGRIWQLSIRGANQLGS
jgi:hypothetical protein